MRAFDCQCGEHMEAQNDEKLFQEARRHSDEDHPNQDSDADLKAQIAVRGYDQRAEA
jgi:hypothetical protein